MCWYCGNPVTEAEPIGRSHVCIDCRRDLRSCKNCRFFLAGSRGDCRESNAQPPQDKERANFCDWFSLDVKYRSKTEGQTKEKDKADASRTAFNNLFN